MRPGGDTCVSSIGVFETQQPEWFDEEFKESVPRELLPTDVPRETVSS